MLDQITPLVLTFDEEANIGRTLAALSWARHVIVVDSFSTDGTLEIARAFPNVQVVQRHFDTHAMQWNFGLQQVATEWVFTLDADYEVTKELMREIEQLNPDDSAMAYSAGFRFRIYGQQLRRSILPPRIVLFRKECGHYRDEGHTQMLDADGVLCVLEAKIIHDDRKPLRRWLQSQISYAELEARHLLSTPSAELEVQDRLRKMMVPAPFLVFGYTLFGQMLIFDGWRGWFYVLQRVFAEILLSLHLLDAKLKGKFNGER